MRKLWRTIVLAGLVLSLGAGPVGATVQVTQVVLSPRMLLDIYHAVQIGSNRINWNDPNIIQLAAMADAASAGQRLAFTVEILDGTTWVARAGRFQVLSRPLSQGANLFNSNDIGDSGLTLSFNSAYAPQTGNLATGNVMPAGNFRVIFTPVDPSTGAVTGPAYIMTFTLFTPRSALDQPPIPIYPRGVTVNTSMPLFSWTSVPNAAAYEVRVGPDQNTQVNTYWLSPRQSLTQALYPAQARALKDGQRYYWQVRALGALGNPIGGVDGFSQAADFTVNSTARATTAVSPAEVEAVLRTALKDPALFSQLDGYRPAAVETTADDLAGLLQDLRNGTAAVISAEVE